MIINTLSPSEDFKRDQEPDACIAYYLNAFIKLLWVVCK